jgi:hypothetical protein
MSDNQVPYQPTINAGSCIIETAAQAQPAC